MKVAALVHFSMPWRCAGSETVLQELMQAAADAGHETTVWCTNKDALTNWRGHEPEVTVDGVRVVRVRNVVLGAAQVKRWRPDVLITHHQHAMAVIKLAKIVGARSVYLVHNQMQVVNKHQLRLRPDLVVFNSDWVREELTAAFGQPKEALTFHPPLTPDRHRVGTTGDAVTLVNLNMDKGAELFYQLAAAEPDRRFLGVVGAHGKQIIRRNLPNVTIHPHTPDMRQVWEQTRILLMPSIYESYGLVAQEAGLNGIPTIANRTPGLVENLGPEGLFADRDDVNQWRSMLSWLDNPTDYAHASDYAQGRAGEALDATRQSLKTWVEWLSLL